MAICVRINANNKLVASNTDVASCTDYVVVSASDYSLITTYQSITSADIATSFSWGFGTYIFFWWLGYVVKNARRVIKLT